MTTARRLRRDRKRYNAIRRIRRAHARQIVRYAFFGGRAEILQSGYVRDPIYTYDVNAAYAAGALDLYNDLITDYALLHFRSWVRCRCGRRRQTIRLA